MNAGTTFGYSYNALSQTTDVYGDKNLALLYQQAGLATERSQNLAGQAVSGLTSLAGLEGDKRAKIVEFLVKSKATSDFLKAMEGSGGKIETKIFSYKMGAGQDGNPDIQRIDPSGGLAEPRNVDHIESWSASASKNCVVCHSGKSPAGKLDIIAEYPQMTFPRKLEVLERLLTDDPTKMMPRTKEGKVGRRLPANEIIYWTPAPPVAQIGPR